MMVIVLGMVAGISFVGTLEVKHLAQALKGGTASFL
jgi:hypothetical protein